MTSLIHRDDLAYTDDVIATLQSMMSPQEIASALNIPVDDVAYHVEEVAGIKHRGTVIRPAIKRPVSVYPTDRSWWSSRTLQQVAEELARSPSEIRTHARNLGYQMKLPTATVSTVTQRVVIEHDEAKIERERQLIIEAANKPKPTYTVTETQRAEHVSRRRDAMLQRFSVEDRKRKNRETMREFRARLNAERPHMPPRPKDNRETRKAAARAAQLASGVFVRNVNYTDEEITTFQRPVEWWSERSIRRASDELGLTMHQTRRLYKLAGFQRVLVNWPTDPAWYAARTRAMIAQELGVTIGTVDQHLKKTRFKANLQTSNKGKMSTAPTDPAWWAQHTWETAAAALGVGRTAIRVFVKRHGLKTGGQSVVQKTSIYPTDPAWWSTRSINQAAAELGVSAVVVRYWAKKHRMPFVRTHRFYGNYPTDPAWWAERTIREAAVELKKRYLSIAKYVSYNGIVTRSTRKKNI